MAPLQIGSLVFAYQPVDALGPLDLLNCSSKAIMEAMNVVSPVDEKTFAKAPEIVFHHIGVNRDPVTLDNTCVTLVPSTTVDECPELDCLIVGGPDPTRFELDPKFAELIRRHVAAGKMLFTNCTGAAVVAAAGVLDGKNATINNVAYQFMKYKYPQVNWTNDKKWVMDGNIWTAGGAMAGLDMVCHWVKETFGQDVLNYGASLLDYEPRDIDGIQNVIPKRYDENGKQLWTHAFP
ncbi:class I glutamine amidotransferase-like protein [Mariannaea sp. PMI_226]|nr:class I glutamine amidotransferase-like protein [Mariannaea sp. PMI_226]